MKERQLVSTAKIAPVKNRMGRSRVDWTAGRRVCGTMLRRYLQTRTGNAFYQNDVLERYGSIDTKLITMRQLMVFGRRLTKEKLLKSSNYLRTELPVR